MTLAQSGDLFGVTLGHVIGYRCGGAHSLAPSSSGTPKRMSGTLARFGG